MPTIPAGPSLKLDCPFCTTKGVQFRGYTEYIIPDNFQSCALFICSHCKHGVVAYLRVIDKDMSFQYISGNIDGDAREFLVCYPSSDVLKIPEHLPENIKGFYREAYGILAQRHYTSAGMMFRKAIETAVKTMDPEGKGDLLPRINALYKKQLVTKDICDWAHQVRIIGNDAAHETYPLTAEDAQDAYNFTEVFLRYTFTLPEMIKLRKKKQP